MNTLNINKDSKDFNFIFDVIDFPAYKWSKSFAAQIFATERYKSKLLKKVIIFNN